MSSSAVRKVALAHALWGFPPHPDSLPAAGQAPDSWKRGFFSQPGAGLLYGGLFSSSRAGRDLALREAPTATWRLDCTAPRSKQALTQQLAGAKQCLALRGAGRRTCVVLTCGRDAATDAALGALADTGADMWSGVTDLTITAGTGDHPSTTIATPTTAGFVCSTVPALYANIRHLTLINCSCKLPTPSELPLLESVVITWLMRVHHYHVRGPTEQDENAMLASLGPFLPQLSSVHVEVVAGRSLQPMFTATSHKLRNFTTSEELTDQLLTALRTHTPALTHLSVEYIAGNISDHSSEHWAVEQLNVQVLCSSDRSIGSIEVLARLPQSTAGGRVGVSSQLGWGELSLTEQGLLGTLMQRLHEFDFQLSTLQLKPLQMLPPCQQPSALRAALQHLSQMQVAADTELRLSGLHWDAAAAEAVAAAAPLLPQYRLCTQVGQLTDGLLGTILRMGTSLKELTVDKVVLQSDQHADVQWPWKLLRVGRGMVDTDMSVFLRLPAPATDTANPPVVYTAYPWQLVSTTQAEAAALCLWLRHVRLDAPKDSETGSDRKLHKFDIKAAESLEVLTARLSVLRAARFVCGDGAEPAAKITISGLNMTAEALAALQGLPSWPGELVFQVTEWPLPVAEYKALAARVPASYGQWRLEGAVPPSVVDSACEGINEHREVLALPPLKLTVMADDSGSDEETEHGWPTMHGAYTARGKHVRIRYQHPGSYMPSDMGLYL